jgi:hypothetical protein
VPATVRRKLREALLTSGEINPLSLAELFDSFQLGASYGVTPARFRSYAKRVAARSGTRFRAGPEYPSGDAPETKSFRRRLARVGSVLSRLAVDLSTSSPVDWGRGAHLALLGHVYMRLMEGGEKIDVTELRELSRIVAEQRRAQTQASAAERKQPARSGPTADRFEPVGHRPLPDNFADVVRELYGTTLQTDVGDAAD